MLFLFTSYNQYKPLQLAISQIIDKHILIRLFLKNGCFNGIILKRKDYILVNIIIYQ